VFHQSSAGLSGNLLFHGRDHFLDLDVTIGIIRIVIQHEIGSVSVKHRNDLTLGFTVAVIAGEQTT
jgi:hypothetical protein